MDETELPTSSYLRKRAKFRQSRKNRNETLVKIESDTSNIQSPESIFFDENEFDGKLFSFITTKINDPLTKYDCNKGR